MDTMWYTFNDVRGSNYQNGWGSSFWDIGVHSQYEGKSDLAEGLERDMEIWEEDGHADDGTMRFDYATFLAGDSSSADCTYILSNEYANSIGYSGPTTYKGKYFICISGKSARNYGICKSQSIKDRELRGGYRMDFSQMVKSQRNRNNRIGKAMDEFEIDAHAEEMLGIVKNELEFDVDSDIDDAKVQAYKIWLDRHGVFATDEDEDKILDELESKLMDYQEELETLKWYEITDLEYNDLVDFGQHGELYVKGTNGRTTYNSCMIWAGESRNSDDGWYISARDFVEVVEHSDSGERLPEFY